jgi:hypothetical protein
VPKIKKRPRNRKGADCGPIIRKVECGTPEVVLVEKKKKQQYHDGLVLPEPGTSTLQAYDAAWAVALGLEGNPYSRSSVDKMNGEELLEKNNEKQF